MNDNWKSMVRPITSDEATSYASCRSLNETGDRWVDISILTGEVEKR